jgi:hypothetical protein
MPIEDFFEIFSPKEKIDFTQFEKKNEPDEPDAIY